MSAVLHQPQGKSFLAMTVSEKLVFLLKLAVFICTMGYAFPRLLVD